MSISLRRHFHIRPEFILRLVVFGVAAHGLLILGTTLLNQLLLRGRLRSGGVALGLPLILGLTLLYLSSLLARRKRTAWAVAMPLYGFIVGLNSILLLEGLDGRHITIFTLLRTFVVPLMIVAGLLAARREFTVKSDFRSFASALRFSVAIMLVALLYGVVGFQLMDRRDFHHEIGLGEAIHRTIDQFDLTSNRSLVPYTRRARVFVDSLSIVSVGAVGYAVLSLFQPLRARFVDESRGRELMKGLLEHYPARSEDFFKLWPHDKAYFFNAAQTAGLAFQVNRGVALGVGDPAGDPKAFDGLLREFDELCRLNDWTPAYIHTEPECTKLYERHDLSLQKIGEEAIVDLEHFARDVAGSKYFRQINNKFTKLGYTTELLRPPHHEAVIARLKAISRESLQQPGRVERGLLQGYFSANYIQQCPVLIARDAAGTIQAFVNQIPSCDPAEANFDFLRHSSDSPGNINDYVLMNFIDTLQAQGFRRLNLGLCPLAGFSDKDENKGVIDSAIRFVYANGDRFYSFSGLHRFKSKYEPDWSDRFIAYRGGLRGFTRAISALNRAMKVPKHLLR